MERNVFRDLGGLVCFDHLGQRFGSEKEMCERWGVTYDEYIRLKETHPLRNVLERIPWKCEDGIHNIVTPTGKTFSTWDSLCYAHYVKYASKETIYKTGFSLEEYFGYTPFMLGTGNDPKKTALLDVRVTKELVVHTGIYTEKMKEKNAIPNLYFSCLLNDEEIILNKSQILDYWRKARGFQKFKINGVEVKDII